MPSPSPLPCLLFPSASHRSADPLCVAFAALLLAARHPELDTSAARRDLARTLTNTLDAWVDVEREEPSR